MTKYLIGFIAGVIATVAAYQLLDSRAPGEATASIHPRAAVDDDASPTAPSNEEPTASVAETARSPGTMPEDNEPAAGRPIIEPPAGSAAVIDPAPSATQTASEPTARRDYSEYPAEIAEILDRETPRPLQARYEAEEREDSWATYMEAQFAAYFASKPGLVQFNISLIDCRSSICEIHAIGYGPDARANWIAATSDIGDQTWHQFNQGSMSTRDVQPDVFAVVWILARQTE